MRYLNITGIERINDMDLMHAMQIVNQFRRNPQTMLQRFGIPAELKTPDEVADYLYKNKRVSQEQIDQAKAVFNMK